MTRWTPAAAALAALLLFAPALVAASTPPDTSSKPAYVGAALVEPTTGRTLFEENAHEPRPVASMTKMMTLLLVMERVEAGTMKLDDPVKISVKATREGGTKVWLRAGDSFPVGELVAAALIHSANDAAMALAEQVGGGSSDECVRLMNERAKALGLTESRFYSPNGFPAPSHPDDVMSALDAAHLAARLMKFPLIRELAAMKERPFDNGGFKKLWNTNLLLGKFPGANGLKTGSHKSAGFCVTGTAQRGDLELIAVVLGSPTRNASFDATERLLRSGFDEYRFFEIIRKGRESRDLAVIRKGETATVAVIPGESVKLLLRKGELKRVTTSLESFNTEAPVRKGQVVGRFVVKLGDKHVAWVPAIAATDVAGASWFQRMFGY